MFNQRTGNKYGAKKTEFQGKRYDSKFEASVAQELDLRLKAGEFVEVIPQYKVEVWCYRENGLKAFKISHKVDFRSERPDGTFLLTEAKCIETSDYKWRRKFLEEIFLPDHPEYEYEVVKQYGGWR